MSSHVELKRYWRTTTLDGSQKKGGELQRMHVNDITFEILTVTKTTFLPSFCCLSTNSRTISTSCCSVTGGGWVSKYDSAEKVVGSRCMLMDVLIDYDCRVFPGSSVPYEDPGRLTYFEHVSMMSSIPLPHFTSCIYLLFYMRFQFHRFIFALCLTCTICPCKQSSS